MLFNNVSPSNKSINKSRGFTLLELLVALSIFSMISVMAYGGLQTVINIKESTQSAATRLADLQLAMLRMGNDLRQAVPRKVRDEHGDAIAGMMLDGLNDDALEWSRAGYSNPASLKRSNLQRVAYKVEDKKLLRLSWPVLDRAQDTEAYEVELLDKVISLNWQFLDNNKWLSSWPPASGTTQTSAPINPLPQAVELVIELEDFGEIRRLILLAQS